MYMFWTVTVMHALMYFKMHHMLLLYLYNISPAGILLAARVFVCWPLSIHFLHVQYIQLSSSYYVC